MDEEDWDVVSDEIPVSLIRIELDGEASHVSHGVGAAPATLHRRKPYKDRGVSRRVRQEAGMRHVRGALVEGEVTESTCSACMDDALGDTLMIESVDLQAPDK